MNRKYTNRSNLDAFERKSSSSMARWERACSQNLTAEHFGGEQYNGCNTISSSRIPKP